MNDGTGTQQEHMSDENRIDIGGMVPEEMPDLSDFAEEGGGGAWPKGWYNATILEGYTTGKGTQFESADTLSKAGTSRNLLICFEVDGGKLGKRMQFARLNYKPEYFSADMMSAVKEAREQFKGVKGAWPERGLQGASLTLARFGGLQKALNVGPLPRHPQGHFLVSKLVGSKVDLYLGMDEDDKYNEIKNFAVSGVRAGKK